MTQRYISSQKTQVGVCVDREITVSDLYRSMPIDRHSMAKTERNKDICVLCGSVPCVLRTSIYKCYDLLDHTINFIVYIFG